MFSTVRRISSLLNTERAGTKASPAFPVLDLPQLYTRPPASELLSTLNLLKSDLHSWGGIQREQSNGDQQRVRVDEDGVPKYLTGIISSELLWVGNEDVREEIWEAASARLAERSGRSGESSLSRLDMTALRSLWHLFSGRSTFSSDSQFSWIQCINRCPNNPFQIYMSGQDQSRPTTNVLQPSQH